MCIFNFYVFKTRFTICAFIVMKSFSEIISKARWWAWYNLKLSINLILFVIVLPFSFSFFIGTEKVIYFSVFSPRHSNCPWTFFCQLFPYKMIYYDYIWLYIIYKYMIIYYSSIIFRTIMRYFRNLFWCFVC